VGLSENRKATLVYYDTLLEDMTQHEALEFIKEKYEYIFQENYEMWKTVVDSVNDQVRRWCIMYPINNGEVFEFSYNRFCVDFLTAAEAIYLVEGEAFNERVVGLILYEMIKGAVPELEAIIELESAPHRYKGDDEVFISEVKTRQRGQSFEGYEQEELDDWSDRSNINWDEWEDDDDE
jgi:hypothetical protein